MEQNNQQSNENLELSNSEETVKNIEKIKNAKETNPCVKEFNNNKASYYFSLPSVNLTSFTYKLNNFNNLKLDDSDSKVKEWKQALEESTEYYTPYFNDINEKKDSLYEQGVRSGEELKSITDFKLKKIEGEIRGEIALLKVAKLLGLGDVINVPLVHSGFWVSIKPPTEKDLMDFYSSLFREKVMLGRSTSGLTLSNFSVFVNSKLVDFILRHVHSTSLSDVKIENLTNYIILQDLNLLAWGFACSIYNNGFEFSRACVKNPEECTYVAKGTIDPKKLLWVDNTSLSEFQKNVLAENRPNKHSVEIYRKYILEFSVKNKIYENKNIKVHFKLPTLNEYFSDGISWVNKVNDSIELAVLGNSEKDEETKKELLISYIKSSILRQYSHLIDKIEIEESIVNDRETINLVLEQLSSDDDIRSGLLDHINKFINSNTVALIGIPEYICPKCNTNQQTDIINDNFVNVIPLDVINLFFGLITLRITKITEREI